MSTWRHVDEKATKDDWVDRGPWEVDVVGGTATGPQIPVGTIVTYSLPSGAECQAEGLQVSIQVPDAREPFSTCAKYSELDGSVSHRSPGIQDGLEVEVLMVASIVLYADDSTPEKRDWHFSGLTVVDDPQDAGVIGAQGGG